MIRPTPEQLAARKAWVAALRSGKYEQGCETLGAWCCLGVACDVSGKRFRKNANFAPKAVVVDWLGFPRSLEYDDVGNPTGHDIELRQPVPYTGARESASLAVLNDAGLTFLQIADLIEAEHIKPYEGEA